MTYYWDVTQLEAFSAWAVLSVQLILFWSFQDQRARLTLGLTTQAHLGDTFILHHPFVLFLMPRWLFLSVSKKMIMNRCGKQTWLFTDLSQHSVMKIDVKVWLIQPGLVGIWLKCTKIWVLKAELLLHHTFPSFSVSFNSSNRLWISDWCYFWSVVFSFLYLGAI